MKKTMLRTVAGLAAMLTVPAMADENANLVINGEIEITVRAPAAAHLENLDEVFSGWLYRADETQVVQMDDFDNPGMIWVDAAAEKIMEKGCNGFIQKPFLITQLSEKIQNILDEN